jgi:putative CocE/NonD family hydrolase
VFLTANYGWAFYVTNNKYLDDETYGDRRRWQELPWKWYRSGRPYREIDQVDGQPNPLLQRWLQHPAYDEHWQRMTANGRDYAKLDIPILAIDGYYDDGQNDAVRRLQEHYRHRPKVEHYLVIGPYDHYGSREAMKPQVIRGYTIDPVAQMDTPNLMFQWFDYIFKGAPKPALLKDKINFQVMGANVWRHASSIAAMSDESRQLYLTSIYKLSPARPATAAPLEMTVNFADRTTVSANTYPGMIITDKLAAAQGLVFTTDPFDGPVSVNGLFSATLRFVSNKKDLDIALVLYEAMPDGKFFHLSYTVARASYAKDMSKRSLLTPGELQTLTLDKTLLVSRQLNKGSRLVLVLDVNRSPDAQVNHGTGKDVSDESIADATEPLKIQWLTDSYITVPMSR